MTNFNLTVVVIVISFFIFVVTSTPDSTQYIVDRPIEITEVPEVVAIKPPRWIPETNRCVYFKE